MGKHANTLTVNIFLIFLALYFWYFHIGDIKSNGGIIWQVLLMFFGGGFMIWSLASNSKIFKKDKSLVPLFNIILPTAFLLFHLYWVLLVIAKLLMN